MIITMRLGLAFAILMMVSNMTGCGGGNADPGVESSRGGSLTLTNAPQSTGGKFIANDLGSGNVSIDPKVVGWTESAPPTTVQHTEYMEVGFVSTGGPLFVNFRSQDVTIADTTQVAFAWACELDVDCSGVALDQIAGTVTFSSTTIPGKALLSDSVPPSPITVNGTLTFTPASSRVADTQPPMISMVTPANSETNGTAIVAPTSSITATFNKPMLTSSINPTTFFVVGVTGTVIYSAGVATFIPSSRLAPNTTYTAMISTGVVDASENANALETDYVWTFTTGAASSQAINTGTMVQ